MPRQANQNSLRNLKQAIEKNPGKCPSFFAHLLGWTHEQVNRGLTSLDDKGVLLYEDEQGGLYPAERTQK